jgi:hypothetical protein
LKTPEKPDAMKAVILITMENQKSDIFASADLFAGLPFPVA